MIGSLDMLEIVAALIAGTFLGAFYFGGLWWTVLRMSGSQRPLYLYFASLAFRMVVAFGGFYFVLILAGWPALIASLVAFIALRSGLVHQVGIRASD